MIESKEIKFVSNGFAIEGTTYIIPGNIENGYTCGFAIFIPKDCEKDTTMIMHSCNTGNNVPIHLNEAIDIAKRSTYEKPNPGIWFGNDLKMPVMIPLIPRVQGYYTQALGSNIVHNDISTLIEDQNRREESEKLTESEMEEIKEYCRDIPVQVVNMIESAKEFLKMLGINVEGKIIVEGYSAGSRFANCFTALYPSLIKACISGGNGGLGILPITKYKGQEIKYPIGVADIPNFDFETFRQIPQLFYIGSNDYNDPVMPESKEYLTDENGKYTRDENGNKIPKTDSHGKIIPKVDVSGKVMPRYKENYSKDEFEQIYYLLGEDPQVRFDNNEEMYQQLGINAIFKKFYGDHNSITQQANGNYIYTNECVKDFIRKVLESERCIVNR